MTHSNGDIGEAKAAARNRWPGILQSLGVDPAYLSGRHGPCLMCGGKDRWRFTDHGGDGMWWCNGCGTGDGFDLLVAYHGWTLREARQKVGEVVGEAAYIAPKRQDEDKVRKSLNTLRAEALPASDVPEVVRYLEGRGLVVPPGLQAHPGLPYYDGPHVIGRYAAMLGKLIFPGGRPVGYHRTYIDKLGRKAPVESPRKIRKLPKTEGYAIRLWPVHELVAIAEGIETAIAFQMLWKVPTWAVISADGMKKFNPPEGIKGVFIAGDNDRNFTGQAAAYDAAHRLTMRGYHVEVHLPPERGDWNDYLQVEGKSNAA